MQRTTWASCDTHTLTRDGPHECRAPSPYWTNRWSHTHSPGHLLGMFNVKERRKMAQNIYPDRVRFGIVQCLTNVHIYLVLGHAIDPQGQIPYRLYTHKHRPGWPWASSWSKQLGGSIPYGSKPFILYCGSFYKIRGLLVTYVSQMTYAGGILVWTIP